MPPLPSQMIAVLQPFASVFRTRVWHWAVVLVVGALLTPGQRTVSAALRILGQQDDPHFQNFHRVLNRDHWSSRTLSQILLRQLLAAFVSVDAPVVVGIDEHIERRRGAKIAAKGIYRDPVRSSKEHFVKTSGLRWISMQLLVPIPWAQRTWALPFFTVLAPSERYHQQRGRRHKTITDWGRQMILQLRRWVPTRPLVIVADNAYSVLDLLARCVRLPRPVTVVTRLRLDAALYDPAPPRSAGTRGRPRLKGKRQPTLAHRITDPQTLWRSVTVRWYGGTERAIEIATHVAVWYHGGMPPVTLRWVLIRDPEKHFETQALLCTDTTASAPHIVEWFVLRWQLEVTFHEARTHLGVETQRQWSDGAILRTTPALFGLFSVVALVTQQLLGDGALPVHRSAWYPKGAPTFAETLAFVRPHLWQARISALSTGESDMVEIPRVLYEHLTNALACAA
jgi:DDE superfamily endonuclease